MWRYLFIYFNSLGSPFNHSLLFYHRAQNTNKNNCVLNKHNVRNIMCKTPKYTNDIIQDYIQLYNAYI